MNELGVGKEGNAYCSVVQNIMEQQLSINQPHKIDVRGYNTIKRTKLEGDFLNVPSRIRYVMLRISL